MKKRTTWALMVIGLALLCLLTACGKGKNSTGTAGSTDVPQTGDTTTTGDGEHVHSFGDWEVVVAATCTEGGYQQRVCACGEAQVLSLLAKGHEHEIDLGEEPTCTATGLTEGTHCAVCGDVLVAQEVIPALGHTEEVDEAVAATCTATGLTEGTHCAVCGEVLVAQQVVAALGHEYQEDGYVSNNDATCTVDGTETAKCVRCDETDTRTVEGSALGHTSVTNAQEDPTCITVGWTGGAHCTVCGAATEAPALIPATGHSYRGGYCDVCGAEEIATSAGLSFTLNEDQQSYTVTGIGTCTDQDVVIPEIYQGLPVTAVGEKAFAGTSITSVTMQAGITAIGAAAFEGCGQLTAVSLPDGLEAIGAAAFSGCTKLVSIKIPNSLRSIGSGAFWYCDSMKGVYITDLAAWCAVEFENVGANPLSVAGKLYLKGQLVKNLVIPDSVITISDFAFAQCTSLQTVIIGSGTASVGDMAFYYCTELTAVVIGENVRTIGDGAFEATALTTITIPAATESIGLGMTAECKKLTTITVAEGNAIYHSAGNCLIETATGTLLSGCNTSVIPLDGSVTAIADRAFQGAVGLTTVTIPLSVQSIGALAFEHCTYIDDRQDDQRIGLTTIVFEGTEGRWSRLEKAENWIDAEFEFTMVYQDQDMPLTLTKDDITLSIENGISTDLYDLIANKEEFDPEKLVVTSADGSVIRVEGTVIYAEGNSRQGVLVTITYGEQSATILVRSLAIHTYTINKDDVTLYLDKEGWDSFELKLTDELGNTLKNLTWSFSSDFDTCCSCVWNAETGILTITAKAVTTGLSGAYVKVWTTYDGETYECIIRIRTEN